MSLPAITPPVGSVSVVRAFFEAVGRRDGGGVGALFADEGELDVPGARLRGAVEIRDLFSDVLGHRLPALRVGVPVVPVAGLVEVPLSLHGRRRRLPLTASFWVDDGRIARLVGRERAVEARRPERPRRSK